MEATLERQTLPEQFVSDEEAEQALQAALGNSTLESAEKQLGYTHQKLLKERERIGDLRKEKPLAKELRVAGIKPFTWQSVDEWKKEKAWCFRFSTENHPVLWFLTWFTPIIVAVVADCTFFSRLVGDTSSDGGGLLGFVVWFFSMVTSCCLFNNEDDDRTSWEERRTLKNNIPRGIVKYLTAIASGSIVGWIGDYLTGPPSKIWQTVSLAGYGGFVPEEALATALEIKTRCPKAELLVDELVDNYRVRNDPFLVAKLDDETYYIEVWDEKGFVGKYN
ncbi:MAG: hypothetical protein WC250_01595 [Candidatus Paceibacterota bacterium]|jgi:hypothetical protein